MPETRWCITSRLAGTLASGHLGNTKVARLDQSFQPRDENDLFPRPTGAHGSYSSPGKRTDIRSQNESLPEPSDAWNKAFNVNQDKDTMGADDASHSEKQRQQQHDLNQMSVVNNIGRGHNVLDAEWEWIPADSKLVLQQ